MRGGLKETTGVVGNQNVARVPFTIPPPNIRVIKFKITGTSPYVSSKLISTQGWLGIQTQAIRNAMLSACKTSGFPVSVAKLGFQCLSDGEDDANAGLIRIYGVNHPFSMSIHCVGHKRAIEVIRWPRWWAFVKVQFDADAIKSTDVIALLSRAGVQVGIGDLRNSLKNPCGLFSVKRP